MERHPLSAYSMRAFALRKPFGGGTLPEGNSFAPFAGEIASAVWGVSFSIIVAVPAIWANRYFSAEAETTVLEMEKLSLAVIEQLFNRQAAALSNASSTGYITHELNANSTRRIGH